MPRYLEIQFDLLQASYDFHVAFYGADLWLRQDLSQSNSVGTYLQFIFAKLIDDFFIGETEKNLILNSALRPGGFTDTDINNLIDLVNDRSANGLNAADFNTLKDAAQRIKSGLEAIRDETPYDDPYFFWNYYLADLWREMFPPPTDPPLVIAKVTGPGDGGGGGSTYTIPIGPTPGEHFYKLSSINDRFVRRGQTNKLGQLDNLILAPDSAFLITYYKPDSNQIALSIFRTPATGSSNRIPVSHFFEAAESDPDTDGDRIPDIAEDIIGTDPNDPDSDGDGVLDGAELVQDGDPLDNQPAAIGLLGNAPASGGLVDLAVQNDLLYGVTTNSTGMEIYDISSGFDPVRISRYPISGSFENPQIAVQGDLAAIALEENGVLILDIRDPAAPLEYKRIQFPSVSVHSIAMDGSFLFAGLSDGNIVTIEALTGLLFAEVELEGTIEPQMVKDLAVDHTYLYARTSDSLKN